MPKDDLAYVEYTLHIVVDLCDLPPSSLKQKIACKVRDEHALVKSMPPLNETVAKMAARNTSLSHGMILL